MADRIATISGVALFPGVSKNGRLYTKETIANAHQRLAERLADPNGRPVTMRTLHPSSGSDMDVTNIAARWKTATLDENGALCFEADIAATQAGKDVAALVTPDDPYLSNVSIRGWWVGDITTEGNVETASDLEIDGLDFVANPGVDAARILSAASEQDDRAYITESVDAQVTIEADALTPGSAYADPGYQKDGKKRYPLDTKAHTRAAWAFISRAKNQTPYTAAQLKRIKGKIKSAAAKFGVTIADESANNEALVESAYTDLTTEITEAMACVSVSNGPADISVSGYGQDPGDLQAVVGRIAAAAIAALDAIDPDADGDIDLPDGSDESHNQGESASAGAPNKGGQMPTDATPEGTPNESLTMTQAELDAKIAESTQAALDAAGIQSPIVESDEIIAARKLIAETDAAKESANTDTNEAEKIEALQKLIDEKVKESNQKLLDEAEAKHKAVIDEAVALWRSGGRKGLVPAPEEGTKPLAELSNDELQERMNEALTNFK